jgi:hypothetical protein
MIDENGEPFFDIFRIIPPWKYYWFKEVRGTYYHEVKDENIMYEFVFELYDNGEEGV